MFPQMKMIEFGFIKNKTFYAVYSREKYIGINGIVKEERVILYIDESLIGVI